MTLKDRVLSASNQFIDWFSKRTWNKREHRPSTIIRIAFGFCTFVVVLRLGQLGVVSGVAITSSFLSLGITETLLGQMVSSISGQVIASAAWVVGIIAAAWYLDRRYIHDLGFRGGWRWVVDFGFGIVVGLGLQTAILFVGLAAGWITVTDTFTGGVDQMLVPWLVTTFVFYVCIGIREEILFRGYLMTNLAEGFSSFDRFDQSTAIWIAVGVSSLCFSLWHTNSPLNFLLFAGCFGILFGAAYALTGSIAIPVGIHTAWNWAETTLFASQSIPTNNLVETRLADPVMIVGNVTSMNLLSYAALIFGALVIIGWVRLREGTLTSHSEIAVPHLHDRRYRRIREMFVVETE